MFKKNRKAFTLIELLAVIVLLAIIALITIPNIVNYIKKSKDQSFKTSVDSIIRSYEYESILDGDLGRVPVCSLDVEHCDYEGYIERDENGNIAIYLDAGDKCVIGIAGTYEIKEGGCAKEEDVPPVINEITISGINILSATAYVTFEEAGLVTSIKFRLKDENDNVVYDWVNADSMDNTSNIRVSKKTFKNLKQGKRYTVEVEVKNNADSNNTATSSKEFETLNYTGPEITYSNEWEKEKTVTITYAKDNGIVNQYRTRSNIGSVAGWENVETSSKEIIIKNYHYYVDAKSQIGDAILTSSAQIGYIDNEADPSNTKPSVEVVNYTNGNGVNTNQVGLELKDTLSGVGSYCVTTTNNVESCIGTGNNTDLNKWVEASNVPEVREKIVLHELTESGTYYVFLKDYVGNVSDSKAFTVYKVHYDLNGGTGTVNDQIKLKGSKLVLTNATPTKEGYEFLEWNTNASSHTASYSSQSEYTNDSNITLYAIWRKEVKVTYNENNGTGTTPGITSCYKYNNEASCEITLSTTSLTRTGYQFKGWSLVSNGAVTYNAGSSYDIADSVTVYAGWKANELTFNNQSFTKTFDTSAQTINIVGASNGNGEYTYSEVSESNGTTSTNYITISNDGTITLAGSTPVGVYTYVVKATSQVNTNVDSYTEVTKEATMTITVNTYNLSNATISDIGAVNYNGTEQKPTPSVTALNVTLLNGTDFTYSYTNNINAGTGTVVITGKGNYTGTKSKTFTINRVASGNTVTCASLTYNGTNQSLISTTNISNGSVYYKIGTELTSSNYTSGSTTKPTAKDAGSYVVYYYAPADNYTETKGSVTCSISKKSIAVSWSNTSFSYNGSSHVPTASIGTGVTNETMTLSVSGAQTNAGSYTATATCSSITTNNRCANYTLTNTSTSFSISKINPTMNLSSSSGTLKIGTNGTITVTGSNYGTLSCSSSNTSYATCSVSGTTVTIVPKAAGSATITVTGAGNTNYNSISKTYAATIQQGYRCTEGTLTADSTKGASSGGYICIANGQQKCSESYDCVSWGTCGCSQWTANGTCYNYGCTDCQAWATEPTYDCYYTCPSGFSTYSGSGSSLKCYKAATL